MNVIAIPYGPKWTTALAGFIVACVYLVGVGLFLSDKRGLADSSIARVLGPTVSMATIGISLIAFLLIAIAALYVLCISLSRSRLIVLHDDHFSFPHGLIFSSVVTVPYKAITALFVEALGTQPEGALRIRCKNCTLLVIASMLPSPQHLRLLHRELATRAQG